LKMSGCNFDGCSVTFMKVNLAIGQGLDPNLRTSYEVASGGGLRRPKAVVQSCGGRDTAGRGRRSRGRYSKA